MPGILDLPTDKRERDAIIETLSDWVSVLCDEIPAGEDNCECGYCPNGCAEKGEELCVQPA